MSGEGKAWQVTAERDDDGAAVDALVAKVFGPGRFAKSAYRLREGVDPEAGLSFVAVENGTLRGSVRFWPVFVGAAAGAAVGAACGGNRSARARHRHCADGARYCRSKSERTSRDRPGGRCAVLCAGRLCADGSWLASNFPDRWTRAVYSDLRWWTARWIYCRATCAAAASIIPSAPAARPWDRQSWRQRKPNSDGHESSRGELSTDRLDRVTKHLTAARGTVRLWPRVYYFAGAGVQVCGVTGSS